MTHSLTIFYFALFWAGAQIQAQDEPKVPEQGSTSVQVAGSPIIYEPEVGSSKVYEMTMAYRAAANPPEIEGAKFVPATKDNPFQKMIFEQTRLYTGKTKVEGGYEADTFEVRNGKKLLRTEFSQIKPSGIFAIGLIHANGRAFLMPEPFPIIKSDSKAGDQWTATKENDDGEKVVLQEIRIIGAEKVRVPAGQFDCIHVRLDGPTGSTKIQRDVWYSRKHGIIRDRQYYFTKNQLLVTEDLVLRKIVAPEEESAEPGEEALPILPEDNAKPKAP